MCAIIINVSINYLRNYFLGVHEELKMCWTNQNVVKEITIDSDKDILFFEFLNSCPYWEQLLFYEMKLVLSL